MAEVRRFTIILMDDDSDFSVSETELEFEDGAEPSCFEDLFGMLIKQPNGSYVVRIDDVLAKALFNG